VTCKQRATDKLERLGWIVGDVERIIRNGPMTRRFDLWSLFDLVAIKGRKTLGNNLLDSSG